MARVLAISSQVARGHVGLSAIVPALNALGHEVIALPTILLSNHPGHRHVAGLRVAPAELHKVLTALEKNGWLARIDAVLTGYLPTPDHVQFAVRAIDRISTMAAARDPGQHVKVLCDPVLGDHPKGLYIDEAAAFAIRETLAPHADFITPNAFELSWLTGRKVDDLESALAAACAAPGAQRFVTSVPLSNEHAIANAAVFEAAQGTCRFAMCSSKRCANVPNGTGDLFAALVLGRTLQPSSAPQSVLAYASAAIAAVVATSLGRDELDLVHHLPALRETGPAPCEEGDVGARTT